MKDFFKFFKKCYSNVFDDSDWPFLLFVAIFVGLVVGDRVERFYSISPSAIFIGCGAVIGAILSYLAIESNREIKEKENERKDMEEYADSCFNMTAELSGCMDKASKLIKTLNKLNDLDDNLASLRKQFSEVGKEISKLEDDGEEGSKKYKSRLERKDDINNRGVRLRDACDQVQQLANEQLQDFVQQGNKMGKACNWVKIYYYKMESNHRLDEIDIEDLREFCNKFAEDFARARTEFFKGVAVRLDGKGHSKEDIEKYRSMDIYGYRFPDMTEMYPKIKKAIRSPGLHVEKKSLRYRIVQHRCFAGVVVFFLVAVTNGFVLK